MKKLFAFTLCFAFLTAAVAYFHSDSHQTISHHDVKPVEQVAVLDAALPVVERPVTNVTVILQKEETALGVASPVYAVARPPNA